jgi:hypothetical protein
MELYYLIQADRYEIPRIAAAVNIAIQKSGVTSKLTTTPDGKTLCIWFPTTEDSKVFMDFVKTDKSPMGLYLRLRGWRIMKDKASKNRPFWKFWESA